MKRVLVLFFILALSAEAFAQPAQESTGDEYRITVFHESESEGEGSSSTSSGGHEYLERIVAVRSDGVEKVYDLPLDATGEERLIDWHFPVRVLDANDGSIELLNREEMELRRDAWLKAAKIPPEACGSWYFTWDAFQIDCDPESVIDTLESIDVQPPRLSDGELFQHPAALEPGHLSLVDSNSEGKTYSVEMPVDPDFFHREEARSDVIVGEVMKKPVSFDDAYAKRKNEQITGVVEVTFDARPDGRVWRRTTSMKTEKIGTDGQAERRISTETVERKALLDGAP